MFFFFSFEIQIAMVAPTIDTATGLQIQPATAYTALPAQYPIYAPTAIYSHLPTTTLIPSALASPGKEGEKKSILIISRTTFDIRFFFFFSSTTILRAGWL